MNRKIELISVNERLPPEGVEVHLLCVYDNGNEVLGMGYYTGEEWEIEYSNNHPLSNDVKYWVDIHEKIDMGGQSHDE